MKTRITKELRHSLLVEDNELASLFAFISSRYKKVTISATCTDGSKFDSSEIDEILCFENPNYRKIKSLFLSAFTDLDENMSLNFWTDRTAVTAEIQIESTNDEQALYTSREILQKIAEMKPWYDLLARIPISLPVLGLWGLSSVMYTTWQVFGLIPRSTTLTQYSFFEIFNLLVVMVAVVFVVIYPLDWAQKQLFPKVFFLLGKQKKAMETIKKWRSFVFSGLIFAIITGVIGNAISNWLLK